MCQETTLSVAMKLIPMQNHETNFIPIAHNLFRIAPFEWQRNVSLKLLDEHFKQNEIRLLCVQPTGGGKTLLYQTVAAQLKGVCIYISILLSLVSDQVKKLMIKTRSDDTTIVLVHVDEVQNKKDLDGILSLVKNVGNSVCVITFASPQSITTTHPNFVHTIKTLIWLVVVD